MQHVIRYGYEPWIAAGFHPHPIIPPRAQVVAPEGRTPPVPGKMPGAARADGKWSGLKWRDLTPDILRRDPEGRFHRSLERGAGIGVRGGEGHIFVDCDIMDPMLSLSLHELTTTVLGDGPTRTGRPPKWATVYRCDAPVAARVVVLFDMATNEKVGQIELIGLGRQIVVQGTHKDTGKPYTWDADPLQSDIPEVDEPLLGSWLYAVTTWAAEHKLRVNGADGELTRTRSAAPSEDLVWPVAPSALLRVVDEAAHPADFDRNDWINVGMALKAALPNDEERAYRAWVRWSQRWEGGDNDEAECAERWHGFRASHLGWRYVCDRLAAGGGDAVAAELFRAAPPIEELPAPAPVPVAATDWPEALDVLADQASAPDLRPEHMPPSIRAHVEDASARIGVDPAAHFLACLACASGVAPEAWAVQMRALDTGWLEQPRIWVAIAAGPAAKKTPTIRAALAPVFAMETEAARHHEFAKAEWMRAALAAKAARKKSEGEGGDPPASLPPVPRRRRYMASDVTPEALINVMRDDAEATCDARGKLLIYKDELAGLIDGFGQYKGGAKGGDRAFWLESWNGGAYSYDRAGRPNAHVPSLSLVVVGGIQPGPLRDAARRVPDDP